jgi:hypothetical protein
MSAEGWRNPAREREMGCGKQKYEDSLRRKGRMSSSWNDTNKSGYGKRI